MTYNIAFLEEYIVHPKAEQTLGPEVRFVIEVALTQETHPFIIPEAHKLLEVTVDVSDAAIFDVHTIAVTGAVASNQEARVWRISPPVVTVF